MGSILRSKRENQNLKDAAAANSGVGAEALTIAILISPLNRDEKQGILKYRVFHSVLILELNPFT